MTIRRGKKKAKPSTALARRPRPAADFAAIARAALNRPTTSRADLEARGVTDLNTLGEEATLGALGLVEIKLTAKEEAILSEPVPVEAVEVKPTGQPYLSHPGYTRLFNRAFGRLGWAIVPRAKPMRSGSSVVCPYVLYIHGQPAAFAMGEQEYFESNKDQTYGDALEATVASALRRCAKRLGVGLELWDRPWLHKFLQVHCVKVWKPGEDRPSFRLKAGPPFHWEKPDTHAVQEGDVTHTEPRSTPAAGHDGTGANVISQKQLGRLWALMKNAGRHETEVRAYILDVFHIDSFTKIKRSDYDAVCKAVEGRGELPTAGGREPGQEG